MHVWRLNNYTFVRSVVYNHYLSYVVSNAMVIALILCIGLIKITKGRTYNTHRLMRGLIGTTRSTKSLPCPIISGTLRIKSMKQAWLHLSKWKWQFSLKYWGSGILIKISGGICTWVLLESCLKPGNRWCLRVANGITCFLPFYSVVYS